MNLTVNYYCELIVNQVAKSSVRANAATLLFNAFPLLSPSLDMKETEDLLAKQFGAFEVCIYSQCIEIAPGVLIVKYSLNYTECSNFLLQ